MDSSNDNVVVDLLRENIRLSRENNRLLKKLWRSHVMSFWSRVVLIAVFVGVPIYVYRVYMSDYVIQAQDAYRQIQENISQFPMYSSQ